jgi:hypothetical protein
MKTLNKNRPTNLFNSLRIMRHAYAGLNGFIDNGNLGLRGAATNLSLLSCGGTNS